MAAYSTKEEEIVAYDYHTNLKHSSYKNIRIAASMFDVRVRDIAESIRDKSYSIEGLYFRVEPRKSFKGKPSIV